MVLALGRLLSRHASYMTPGEQRAGQQTGLFRLEGQPVALAAHGHQLVVVWHEGPPTPAGDQALAYALYDIPEQRRIGAGSLPLSLGASLTW